MKEIYLKHTLDFSFFHIVYFMLNTYFFGHSVCARYRTNGVTNLMAIMIVSYINIVQQSSDIVAFIA
jgi:hypothetical protein